MKATDLMIGDWVSFKGKNAKVYRIDMANGAGNEYAAVLNGDVCCAYLEPIPLTPEILENNGYKRGLLIQEYKISDGLHYNLEGGLLLFGHEYGTVLEIKCNYVHELQHALRLCGIDKEITL